MEFHNVLTGETVTPEDWQMRLKVGDYYIIETPTLAAGNVVYSDLPKVYGHIISDEDCDEGYFWVEAFSQLCPDGETGILNICDPSRLLTEDEFNKAKANGWA